MDQQNFEKDGMAEISKSNFLPIQKSSLEHP